MQQQLKQQLNHMLVWIKAHKTSIIIALLSLFILIFVLNLLFGFRLKKQAILAPEYIYQTGEAIEVDYQKITAGELPEVIEIIAPTAENMFRSLSMNLVTTNIIIEDHLTGTIWETLKVDPTLNSANQDLQRAPLFLTYMYEGWTTGKRLDALTHSISKQKYDIEIIDHGVRVIYHMGVHTPALSWMPQRITEELYNTLHQQTDTSGKIALQNVYNRPTGASFYQIVNSIAQPFIDRIYGVWYEEYGLTFETLFELNAFYNIRNNFIEIPSFKIPVEYTLDQGDFIARVVLQEIEESSLSFEDGKTLFIQDIDVLPYFFSSRNAPDTFMFVPDGSGAIILLDRPDFNYARYTKGVYDARSLLSSNYTNYVDQESILMPVFGFAKAHQGIFGIIEHGAMQSLMQIRRASSNNALNAIYPSIIYRHKDVYSLSGVVIDMYSNPLNDTDYQVRYQLLQDDVDHVDYMTMVEGYQSYLFGSLTKQDFIPDVHVNLIGAMKDIAFFVGIPYEKMIALTSFKDALNIMKALDGYVSSYSYLGWSEGGLQGSPIQNQRIERALGSKRDFEQLRRYASDQQLDLALEVALLEIYETNRIYRLNRHGVRLVGDYTRSFYPYDLSRMLMQDGSDLGTYFLLSPSYLSSVVNRLISKNTYGANALELRDLGHTFLADFGRSGYAPSLVESLVNDELQALSSAYDLTLKKPFMHAALYATRIADAPYRSSQHYMFSYDVPFYQLVLNGYLPYRLESTNVSPLKSGKMMFLKALSSGAGLTYDVTEVSSSITKTSAYFNYMHATQFDIYQADIMTYSNQLRDIYQALGTNIMIHHQTLEKDVMLITYQNSKQMIINLTSHEYTYLGQTIEPLDYLILGG